MKEKLLILDLDETLVHCTREDSHHEPSVQNFMGYKLYYRPGLQEFLETVSTHYELAIWSSASDDYVRSVRNLIAPDREFQFVWGRSRCINVFDPEMYTRYQVKDLRKVKKKWDLSKVLIADDTSRKLCRNYGNLVRVEPFYGDPADRELDKLGCYLVDLAPAEDFRAVEKRGWRKNY